MINKLKWIATIVVAFFAGYFTHLVTTKNAPSTKSIVKTEFHYNDADKPAHQNDHASFSKTNTNEPVKDLSTTPERNFASSQSILNKEETKSVNPENPTEAIQSYNKSTPKPFNEMLEKVDGDLRKKYKDYAASDKKDDWDIRMQSKITDFILSRPAATDIKIDSVNCNSNICELRLEEQKRFLLMATFAELLQESWIINEATGQFNFSDKYGYMLLMRK